MDELAGEDTDDCKGRLCRPRFDRCSMSMASKLLLFVHRVLTPWLSLGPIYVLEVKKMGLKLRVKFAFPPIDPKYVESGEFVERQVQWAVVDPEGVVQNGGGESLSSNSLHYKVTCDPGQKIALSIRDLDDNGNLSEPSSIEFVPGDVVPMPTPGALSVASVEEIDDTAVVETGDTPET